MTLPALRVLWCLWRMDQRWPGRWIDLPTLAYAVELPIGSLSRVVTKLQTQHRGGRCFIATKTGSGRGEFRISTAGKEFVELAQQLTVEDQK